MVRDGVFVPGSTICEIGSDSKLLSCLVELSQIGFMGCQNIMQFLKCERILTCADGGDQITTVETKSTKNVKGDVIGRQRSVDDGKFIDGVLDILKISSNRLITLLKKGEVLIELHHMGSRLICI